MTYRQSEMYSHAKYLKNLPLQSVSSRRNFQVELQPVCWNFSLPDDDFVI